MATSNSEKISLSTATMVGMNAMIGAGIFAIPSLLAGEVGPAGILSFAFMVVATWFMAQSLARLAQLFPQEGSFYTYAKQWGGHYVGIIANASYLIGLLIAMGLLTHNAGQYLAHYVPDMSAHTLGIIALAVLTFFNILGVSLSTLGQQILIALTIIPIGIITLLCFLKADVSNLTPFAPYGWISALKATRVAAFAFFGFEASTSLFNTIENPEKNLPRAISYASILTGIIYLTFVTALILAVPLALFKSYPGPISGPLTIIFPQNGWLIEGIHIATIAAILGTIHSMIWAGGEMLLSFIKKLKNKAAQHLLAYDIINHRSSTLLIGLAIFGCFSICSDETFFYFTALFVLLAFSLSMITLLFIKEEWRSKQNYITIGGLMTAGLITFFAVMGIINTL